MNLSENLNNSFLYTKKLLTDPRRLVILIVLSFLSSRLSNLVEATGLLGPPGMNVFGRVLITAPISLVGVVIGWFIGGYYARTLRLSPSSDSPPPLDRFGELFIDGVKIFFAGLIYVIAPGILFVVGGASVFFGMIGQTGTVGSALPDIAFGGIGVALILIGFVLLIALLIILVAGIAHMVKTRQFGKAFAFREILQIIGRIGWARYIAWMIVIGVISLVVLGVASAIPYVGWILSAFVSPFVGVFSIRSLAILYNDGAPPELKMSAPIVSEALVCSSCGTPLQPHQKFCPNCGTAAPSPPPPPLAPAAGETRFCISCGARIPATAKFCGTCGAKQT